jgi:hypothetical protein
MILFFLHIFWKWHERMNCFFLLFFEVSSREHHVTHNVGLAEWVNTTRSHVWSEDLKKKRLGVKLEKATGSQRISSIRMLWIYMNQKVTYVQTPLFIVLYFVSFGTSRHTRLFTGFSRRPRLSQLNTRDRRSVDTKRRQSLLCVTLTLFDATTDTSTSTKSSCSMKKKS